VKNNIFLRGSVTASPLADIDPGVLSHDYNCYWPTNGAPAEPHGVYADPELDLTGYYPTNLASPVIDAAVVNPICTADLNGWIRDPASPCIGAVEVLYDDFGSEDDMRDSGGRIRRRELPGRRMVFHHNGFGRLRHLSVRGIVNVDRDYRYSAYGHRTGITTTNLATGAVTTERYSYDGHDVDLELIRTVTATSTNDRTRVYWNVTGEIDQRIGFVDTVRGVATFYYYLTDQVGTVLQIVREDGAMSSVPINDGKGRVFCHFKRGKGVGLHQLS
jgi:hypothetical protein